jgi:hypothetical protein
MPNQNRWWRLTPGNQRKLVSYCTLALVAVGCVFGASAQAASVDISMMSKADHIGATTTLNWAVSNQGLNCPKPLPAGAEIIMGQYQDSFIGENATYMATTSLNNLEIIQQDTERMVTMENGIYTEEFAYFGAGNSANPLMICGDWGTNAAALGLSPTDIINGSNPNENSATAYCEIVIGKNFMSNGEMKYQSQGRITAVDITPDKVEFQALSEGNLGIGSMSVAGTSMAGLFNTSTLGYTNDFHQSQMTHGNYQMSEAFTWTSFRNTWDFPENLPETTG